MTDDKLYTLRRPSIPGERVLDLRFGAGTQAYAFTFG